MPLITIKTMKGCSKEAIENTMKEINSIVAKNLGYDPSHVWVFTEEVEDNHFLTAGKTWEELRPLLYGKNNINKTCNLIFLSAASPQKCRFTQRYVLKG